MKTTYLDHAATTSTLDAVREAMLPFLTGLSGNPSSAHHVGRRASAALEDARERVAGALGVDRPEVFFVRGGTESDNVAILGRARHARSEGRVPVVAHSVIEHSAVVEAASFVEETGGRRIEIPVLDSGALEPRALDEAIGARPDVVSVMWVNNEIGTILPVAEIARRTRTEGVVLHTDAVQAIGKVEVALDTVPVDLVTLTGHKIGGPRGTGVLVVRRGVVVDPLLHGGGQEGGLRPGTEDVAGAVGMAVAVEHAVSRWPEVTNRLEGLREEMERLILQAIPGACVFGAGTPRAPHVLSLGIPGVSQELLLAGLDLEGVACSGGSACHSDSVGRGGAESSHVLRALYGDDVRGFSVLRFSFGSDTERADIAEGVAATKRVVARLRQNEEVHA